MPSFRIRSCCSTGDLRSKSLDDPMKRAMCIGEPLFLIHDEPASSCFLSAYRRCRLRECGTASVCSVRRFSDHRFEPGNSFDRSIAFSRGAVLGGIQIRRHLPAANDLVILHRLGHLGTMGTRISPHEPAVARAEWLAGFPARLGAHWYDRSMG